MTTQERIFLESKAWTQEKLNLDPTYFSRLDKKNHPKILWIGSTESLVPVRELTNTDPGEVLVYRNMASQVRADDPGMMAMIEDSIEFSKVGQIVVCVYSHCDGIRHVLRGTDKNRPALSEWLRPIRRLYENHRDELEGLSLDAREKKLSELNVREQIVNLSKLPVIQKAWEKTDHPHLFGWYFDLKAGALQDIYSMKANHTLKPENILV